MLVFMIILLVAALIAYKMFSDTPYVRKLCKNRTPEQKKVIRYFCNPDGCLSRRMSDEEYEGMVNAVFNSMDFKKKALNKIGLDESEVNEIDPVSFRGPLFGKNAYARLAKGQKGCFGKYYSSAYQISWLFFSSTQVYVYQYTFNMDEEGKKETTEEYFYRDITNFSTSTDTVETPMYDHKKKKDIIVNVDSNRFALTVPGDKFYCSMGQNDETEKCIQGMKAKLREKKS